MSKDGGAGNGGGPGDDRGSGPTDRDTGHTDDRNAAGERTNELVEEPDIDDLLDRLDALERTVDEEHERHKVRQTISLVERMPGSEAFTKRVRKYTTRDVAESFVGSIIFAFPLLVEGGVFEIATYFVETRVATVPIFFVLNLAFVVLMTIGLLYYADFRDVQVHDPLLGFIPRRLVGVLVVALITSVMMMVMWGRHIEGGPTTFEIVARVSVVWSAASFGGALGDILPGESKGREVSDLIGDIGESIGFDGEE